MNNHITFRQAKKMLDSQHLAYEILDLGRDWKAILTQYSGRLLGPFKGEDGESVLWVNAAMKDEASFKAFVDGRQLHLGGERFWINPELRFFCKAPELFDATYTVQDALDPGHYAISREGEWAKISQQVALNALDTGEQKRFDVEVRYAPAGNPLTWVKALKELDVDYCGYTQEIDLRDLSMETDIPLEPWSLTQVNPEGGRVVTPFFGPFEFLDYYDPVEDMQRVKAGYAECDTTGDRKYKVAYRSASTFGRMGFVKPMNGGWHLMVRNYYNDPSLPYLSEPWGDLGNRGCSTYYYNDDLSNGGFAEFENGGVTVGPGTGREHSTSISTTWYFFGGQEAIGQIMRNLLGIEFEF